MNVLSFGAGVNSTALIILHLEGKLRFDAVIFADTGCEMPDTYAYLVDYVQPACDVPFHIVERGNLLSDYTAQRIIPCRMFRSCTDKYKIRPIRAFLKTTYGDDYRMSLGIDAGEAHRAQRFIGAFDFPLITRGIDRDGCTRIIEDYGWPLPVKSGCFFCPFMARDGWIALYHQYPGLYAEAEAFEQNGRRYPELTLTTKRLDLLRVYLETQTSLDQWVVTEEPCVMCHL